MNRSRGRGSALISRKLDSRSDASWEECADSRQRLRGSWPVSRSPKNKRLSVNLCVLRVSALKWRPINRRDAKNAAVRGRCLVAYATNGCRRRFSGAVNSTLAKVVATLAGLLSTIFDPTE